MHLYRSEAGEDHVALTMGNVAGCDNLITRVHSECFTSEVLGSLRCDCSLQLRQALARIALEGLGILIYLRQEGRGIGLMDKLLAYNLQDQGYDTVDANLLLGHGSDDRVYDAAARILRDFGVKSVRMLTNNPLKIQGLRQLGVAVTGREPLVAPFHPESTSYLQTKAIRMGHEIGLSGPLKLNGASNNGSTNVSADLLAELTGRASGFAMHHGRPFVTVSYAQSLDGCLSSEQGKPLALSGQESLTLTHRLRAAHDAVMVGIGTVLSDNPRLTVRRIAGPNPRPIVIDSRLRIPLDCNLVADPGRPVWLATVDSGEPSKREALEAAGATLVRSAATGDGRVDLADMLPRLAERGIHSVMVEGGIQVIRSLLAAQLVDYLVVTIAPRFVGAEMTARLQTDLLAGPEFNHVQCLSVGSDLILWGVPAWKKPQPRGT